MAIFHPPDGFCGVKHCCQWPSDSNTDVHSPVSRMEQSTAEKRQIPTGHPTPADTAPGEVHGGNQEHPKVFFQKHAIVVLSTSTPKFSNLEQIHFPPEVFTSQHSQVTIVDN